MMNYKPPANILENRIILITGAGDGIGRAAAKAFAEQGATVVLLGRSMHKLEKVYDEIEQAGYPEAAIYPMNLEGAGVKDYEDLATRLDEEFGRLDGLLHNAAQLGSLTPLELYDVNLWYQVMQVNLHAPFMLTQACLGILKKSPDASVILTGDAVGRQGRAYWGAYAASKAGLEALAQVLADETESNTSVRVNVLDPGKVRTRMRSAAYPGEDPGSLPEPETLMPAYIYLIGPDSKGITGQRFNAQ